MAATPGSDTSKLLSDTHMVNGLTEASSNSNKLTTAVGHVKKLLSADLSSKEDAPGVSSSTSGSDLRSGDASSINPSSSDVSVDSRSKIGYFNALSAKLNEITRTGDDIGKDLVKRDNLQNDNTCTNNGNDGGGLRLIEEDTSLCPIVNLMGTNNTNSANVVKYQPQGLLVDELRLKTDESAIWSDLSMDIENSGSSFNRYSHLPDDKSFADIRLSSPGAPGERQSPASLVNHSRSKRFPFSPSRFCPLPPCLPRCPRRRAPCAWASIKMFCFLACSLITVHGALATGYTFSVLTTIEKRFTVNSVIAGFVISSYEVGSLLSVVFVSYFGTHGHIPRWIGLGGLSLCVGSFLFSFPHFIAPEYKPPNINDTIPVVCSKTDHLTSSAHSSITKQLIDASQSSHLKDESTFITGYVYILIIAQIFLGAGGSPIFTLGTSYIDNHVEQNDSSIYLAFMYVMMAVGPICGFLLGALMLGEYVDPFKVPPKMRSTSPYWIGLWWGGYIICGIFYLISSFPFFLFPRRLSTSKELSDKESEYGRSWRKIPASVSRLLSNSVYMVASWCACVELAIVSGFTTFLPKYIETQFSLSPSSASGLTGLVAIPGACVGIFFGGWVIKYFKLEMKGVANYVVIVNCLSMIMLTLFFAFGCDNMRIAGLTVQYDPKIDFYDRPLNLTSSCNFDCSCRNSKYSPVCGANNITYVSPCHAGCTSAVSTGKQRTDIVGDVTWDTHNFTGCTCLLPYFNESVAHSNHLVSAKEGVCLSDCKMLAPFLVLLFLISLAASNNQMPLVLTTLRSVSEEEKAFALGLQLVLLRLFGYIPAPILYGAVIDSACMLPSDSFVRRDQASCLLYDVRHFRFHFAAVSMVLMVVAFLLSVILWWSVRKRYTPFSPPVTMSEIVHRLGDIDNLHIRRSTASSLRSWVSDDSLYSRPRSPRHQKTMSC